MPFEILRKNITEMEVDAIVNSTSSIPFVGEGVDRAIHDSAGPNLFIERKSFGIIKTGECVMTKGYDLPSKHVIHVVGPMYNEGHLNDELDLYNTYKRALELALDHDIQTIAFPLISSGTFMFPRGKALEIALYAIKHFLKVHEMMIYLLVFDEASYQVSLDRFISIKNYIDDHFEPEIQHMNSISFDDSRVDRLSQSNRHQKTTKTRFIDDLIDQLDETFSTSLFRLIDERKLLDINVYKKANIDRKLFSKIKSNSFYQPSKITVIAFALALELNLDETKDLLAKAGYALSPSSIFDKIIEFFIEKEVYDLYEINQVLFAFEQKTLGGLE